MLESFLVAGRQGLEGRPAAYGQSITDACMDWDTTSEVLEQLARGGAARRGRASGATDEGRRPRRRPDRRIDRARRPRARRGRGGGRLRPRPGAAATALELGAIDRAAESLEEALDGAEICFACAPVARSRAGGRRAGGGRPDCVVTDVGSTKQGLRRRVDDRASSAGTRSRVLRPPASSTPAPTCSRARSGT